MQAAAISSVEPHALPGRETLHGLAQPLCPDRGREHASGAGQESPALVEIVDVLVVAEQHGIDCADRFTARAPAR
jgi:hypothetical protein